MCVMNIMNILRTGMNLSISHSHIMAMLQSDSHEALYFVLDLVGIQSVAASMWAVVMFSYSPFRVCLSDIS